MATEKGNSYDQVPYESNAFRDSHPDNLATMANLFGMSPAPMNNCRVLELGCASGGNIIPLAVQFPKSSFTGIDLSSVQIAEGDALIKKLKLKNIKLLHQSILDVEKQEYDFIVCHGVYSWVPDAVKEKIMAICGEQLAPQGVAYISYNTYPGWHFRGMIRDMMIYHTKHLTDPKTKVFQARALLDFLAQSAPAETAYGKMLKDEANLLRQHKDSYLLHEHLEEANHPLYFHEFAERADELGLRYLGESAFSVMMTSNFSKQVTETLKQVANDIIRTEQYMDFLRNRTFRQTLLCRKDIPLKRNLSPDDMTRFFIGSSAKPVPADGGAGENANKPEKFATPTGASITPGHPLTKAAFHHLAQTWPQSAAFDTLLEEAAKRGGLPWDKDNAATYRKVLSADMLTALTAGLIELRLTQLDFVTRVSDKPVASELAREQATKGRQVTNQRHEPTNLDDVNQHLIKLLDGKTDRAAMLDALLKLVANGALRANQQDGKTITDDAALRTLFTRAIDIGLGNLAKSALLVG